ncbi:hypothetical protein H4Q26_002109 [Puccinia striiformis f. sp. tritici PST-130]|nr:hypothetical protein H4Q26_002109 [Puccinia striiformis f. sp. tritici PST-130]
MGEAEVIVAWMGMTNPKKEVNEKYPPHDQIESVVNQMCLLVEIKIAGDTDQREVLYYIQHLATKFFFGSCDVRSTQKTRAWPAQTAQLARFQKDFSATIVSHRLNEIDRNGGGSFFPLDWSIPLGSVSIGCDMALKRPFPREKKRFFFQSFGSAEADVRKSNVIVPYHYRDECGLVTHLHLIHTDLFAFASDTCVQNRELK